VSFDLQLDAAVRTWHEAECVAAATASPERLSVIAGRRKRWGRKLRPTIRFDLEQGQGVLSDDADLSEDAFTLDPAQREALATTVLTLAEVLQTGFGIRACWVGDPLMHQPTVTAEELADLIRRSKLNRLTMYRVDAMG
jgi:hypothetical protein